MEWSEKINNDWAFAGEIEAHNQTWRAQSLTFVYLIYQALIFSTVTGALPGGAGADHWWIPAVLSVSLSVVFFSYLVEAVVVVDRAQHGSDLARMELGPAHKFRVPCFLGGPTTPEEVRYRSVKRRVVLGVAVGLLVAFAAVMAVACWAVSPGTAVDGGLDSGGIEYVEEWP